MRLKSRLVAIAVAVALFVAALTHPAPARADTEEAFIYAGVAVAAYIVFLVVATSLVYGGSGSELAPTEGAGGARTGLDEYLRRHQEGEREVRFGSGCAQSGTTVTLVCW